MVERRAKRTLRLLGVAVAALVLAPAAANAETRAQGSIDGSGTTYALAITNTSTNGEPIRCFQFVTPEGVTVTSVSPPGRLASPQSSPPNRSLIFGDVNIPAGGDLVIQFTTAAPYPENGGGTLQVSTTCTQGSDSSSTVTGPVFACRCIGLTASLTKFSYSTPRELDFKVKWRLGCSAGTGTGCKGRIKFEPLDPGHKFTKKENVVECSGPCARTTEKTVPADGRKNGRTVRTGLDTLLPKGFERDKRGGKSIKIRAKLFCLDGDTERLFKTLTFKIVFKKGGAVDGKKSDLNGDGKKDKPAKKK